MELATIHTINRRRGDDDTLGGRISRARDALGLSVSLLARRVGVNASTIQAWENDRSEPGVERLAQLAGVLEVPLVWLLHGVGDAPVDDIGPDPLAAVTAQLEKLKRMHADTGQIIDRLQREIRRLDGDR